MSSPWSSPDAGNSRPGPVPPPAPPGPPAAGPTAAGSSGQAGPYGIAGGAGADEANPFAPPSADDGVPLVPGSQYGRPMTPGAYGAAPVWPTLPGHDPLAITALVCGIVGFVILPLPLSPTALGLGIASLVRITRGGYRGKGMAITAVVMGGLGTLGMLALGALFGLGLALGAGF